MNTKSLKGYLVSIPIPWNDKGVFIPDLFQQATQKLLKEGCDGIYLFGTSGEGYAVSDKEFTEIVNLFALETESFNGFRQVGCFGLSSDQVKSRCEIVKDHGINGVQITLPAWKALTDAELVHYFTDVCGTFKDLSFLLYNNPRNKRRLKGQEIEWIHKRVPNLQGAKTAPPSWFDAYELITHSPSVQNFVTEPAFLFSYGLGAAGLIPSSNYAMPEIARAYYEAVLNNDLNTGHKLHQRIIRFLYRTAFPLIEKGYIDGAIDKAYARIGGMDMPLNMKSPYLSLSETEFNNLQSCVQKEFVDKA
jgi:dihydrodipicolinate synthase/N-acetylneuraminate lyase